MGLEPRPLWWLAVTLTTGLGYGTNDKNEKRYKIGNIWLIGMLVARWWMMIDERCDRWTTVVGAKPQQQQQQKMEQKNATSASTMAVIVAHIHQQPTNCPVNNASLPLQGYALRCLSKNTFNFDGNQYFYCVFFLISGTFLMDFVLYTVRCNRLMTSMMVRARFSAL